MPNQVVVPSVLAICTNCTNALTSSGGMTYPVHLVESLVPVFEVERWESQGYTFEKRTP